VKHLDISNLTTKIIEAMGGAVEFTEYALAQVLLPEKYISRFQGRTEMLLAFDYEVAEENPGSDFVTFGSEVFESLLDIALTTPVSDVRYAIVDRIEIVNPEERIRRTLGSSERLDIKVLSERPIMGIWAIFVFRTRFISSESFEDERKVWVNMLTGNVDVALADFSVFFEREPLHEFPYGLSCSFSDAYKTASTHLSMLNTEIADNAVSPLGIIRETERIQSYYEELMDENNRRLSRKGLTDERKEDIHKKHEALQLEMERQINEIKENMIPKQITHLAHGITLHIPVIELVCTINTRHNSEQKVFYYECLTKQVYPG